MEKSLVEFLIKAKQLTYAGKGADRMVLLH